MSNKYGSRHRKAWATGFKAKHGKFRKIGQLSRAAPRDKRKGV